MAKNKRKPSAAQRDKVAVETAKILKRKGVLSKSTKLHGGKFVSRSVLKKVQEFQVAAKPSYTALKVTPAIARAAKAEGYMVAHGRVIVPREHEFIKRVKQGMVSGIKPVNGGVMSEVQVPFRADNSAEALEWLETGQLNNLKLEHEVFAFRIGGEEAGPRGMSYRTFSTTQQIREYLQYYKPDALSSGFKLYRLHPEDMRKFIRSVNERRREAPKQYRKGSRERARGHSAYRYRMERLERVNPAKAERIRNANRERSKERYEKRKLDPEYMKRQRERALRRYYEKKGK